MVAVDLEQYLKASEVIDWQHPDIVALAHQLASGYESSTAIAVGEAQALPVGRSKTLAKHSFEWVRDQIRHSSDYQMNPVTCRASEVLKHKTGYCFAKSHLLAALLRANHIPAGFCYQRLSIDDQGAPYSLHGFNAIYLPDIGWYRVDARGNKPGVNAQFTPPQEQLAFRLQFAEEADFPVVLAEPLPIVVSALRSHPTWDEMLRHLPDILLKSAKGYGLV
ncbi:transglutaminase family protein [Acaryochloris sp. IP29b_bin.148]|uniref:transglutaminase-like domain-containing protein n=1 Tax=Acaryochloris sp. IP29b_bin.148 TaxID=2969218 RepID=UPI00261E3E8D|nr:transglutaminase family protein [Acaryochloris sp. IP29b_bin.148]